MYPNYRQPVGLAPGQPDCRIPIVEDRKEDWLFSNMAAASDLNRPPQIGRALRP
jgi:hypothetical protein